MPPPPRAREALVAMKNIGFSSKVAGPILKKLLEVYENNWEYIEQDGYQVLIDGILEEQEKMAVDGKTQDAVAADDPEHSRKRLRKESEFPSSSMLGSDAPGETSLKKSKPEANVSPQSQLREGRAELVPLQVDYSGRPEPESLQADNRGRAELALPEVGNRGNMTELSLPQSSPNSEIPEHDLPLITQRETRGRMTELILSQSSLNSEMFKDDLPLIARRETRALARARKVSAGQENAEQGSPATCSKEEQPAGERPRDLILKEPKIEPGTEVLNESKSTSPPKSKDKEADDLPEFEVPIAMIPPRHPFVARTEAHQSQSNSSLSGISCLRANASLAAPNVPRNEDKGKGKESYLGIALENGKTSELVTAQDATSTIDIASSDTGTVKLQLSFNSDCPDLRMPSIDAFFKTVEERCLKSYKILTPDFSLLRIMKEMCQVASELTTEPSHDKHEKIVRLTPASDSTKKSEVQNMLGKLPVNGSPDDLRAPEDSRTSQSLTVVQQPQITLGDLRPPHDPSDITKGEERIIISLVNEVSNEKYPPSFHYIPRNLVYQNAYVNFSLARIGDEDCCSDCYGDCLAATVPCACARETGGEFAYTSDGLVKEAFLDECISMNREPQKHHHVYCEDCPLERSKKGAVPGSCKGHLVRKFIKECWSKCGCSMHCTNRTVQRGINCNLQVFFTPEGKGWGLRTLDELPKGAFVCEYVGEVLTNMELYNRTIQSTGNAKHTYPVLLDADWGSERVLKDEEALCLDATFYGNVARFVNHRCVDANMVEIPVTVETPDRHYYHLAFFTTRRIKRFEELTWDYGIDFDDVGHPVKAFKCRCENAALQESMANLEHLTSAVHRLRVTLLKAQDDATSDGPLESAAEALRSAIAEAIRMKTALGSSLPVSWTADAAVDAATYENLCEPTDPVEAIKDRVNPVSSAGLEMAELLILAAQLLQHSLARISTSEDIVAV